MKRHFKQGLLTLVSGATRRTAVLLGAQAGDDSILPLRAAYRVDAGALAIDVEEPRRGVLRAAFSADGDSSMTWLSDQRPYSGPARLLLSLEDGRVQFGGTALGSVSDGRPVTARRFTWTFTLALLDGTVLTRQTSHYVARDGRAVDATYYQGEDYSNYEAQSEAVHRQIVDLARANGARGPVLEVGCATGGTLAALRADGIDGCGLDLSAWAVDQARRRLGDNVVWQCNIEHEPIPSAVAARGPFGLLVLASVFEHFDRPFAALDRLTPLAAPGATAILLTTNADSLTHRIFGSDWEGFFDWTHHGVEQVSAATLRDRLPRLGWRIRDLWTWHVWDASVDPTRATLREWNAVDARFRRLLIERDLGDFVTCVAVRA